MTTFENMTTGGVPEHPDRMWADDRLEAWLAGDLKEADVNRFEQILATDDWLAAEVKRAQEMDMMFSDLLDSAELVRCPDSVTAEVMAHARKDWLFQHPRRLQDGFRRMASAGLKPALAMTLLLMVVLSSTWIARSPSGPATANNAEVTQALADVKMALAVLADAGQSTGTAVGADVIGPYVVRPMARGMNTVIEN